MYTSVFLKFSLSYLFLTGIYYLVTLGCIAIGCSVGWFSPALLVFTSEDTPLDGPMSSFDVGWIIAYFEIGSLFGVFLFGLIASYIGNQRSIILSIIPVIVSHNFISIKSLLKPYC